MKIDPKSPEGKHWKKYFFTDPDEFLGHIKRDKKTGDIIPSTVPTKTQMENRKKLYLKPDQVEALATWAYKRNLKDLQDDQGFLHCRPARSAPAKEDQRHGHQRQGGHRQYCQEHLGRAWKGGCRLHLQPQP